MKLAKKVATNAKFNLFVAKANKFLLLFLLGIFIGGCSKDDKPNNPNSNNNNSSWDFKEDDPSLIKLTKLDSEIKKYDGGTAVGSTIIVGKQNVPANYEPEGIYILIYWIENITKNNITCGDVNKDFWGDVLDVNEAGKVNYGCSEWL